MSLHTSDQFFDSVNVDTVLTVRKFLNVPNQYSSQADLANSIIADQGVFGTLDVTESAYFENGAAGSVVATTINYGTITGDTSSSLSDLTDVTLTNLVDNEALLYNSSTTKWVNSTIPIESLNGVTGTPSTGDILLNDGSDFATTPNTLNNLSNVSVSGPLDGQAVVFSSPNWVPGSTGGGIFEIVATENIVGGTGTSKTLGSRNIIGGIDAGSSLTASADDNTLFGNNAGAALTTENQNVLIGNDAGAALTGNDNTCIGVSAGAAASGDNNTYVGHEAGNFIVGNDNTAIGAYALRGNPGGAVATQCTAVGSSALYNITNGSDNTAVGFEALYNLTTGSKNTAAGYRAGYTLTTQNSNTFVGYQSGYNIDGDFNIFLGAQTVLPGAPIVVEGAIVIGKNATIASGHDNCIVLGHNANTAGKVLQTTGAGQMLVHLDGSGLGFRTDFLPTTAVTGVGNTELGDPAEYIFVTLNKSGVATRYRLYLWA